MQKIADQRNGEPREIALVIADRIHIEQPLRRMCMPAVARIDDMQMRRAMLRNQERRAASRMPDDAHIRPHRAAIRLSALKTPEYPDSAHRQINIWRPFQTSSGCALSAQRRD